MEKQTAELTIRRLTEADIPFAMDLKNIAGWNQTERDWRGYLSLEPDGCFLAELDGRPAGTVTAIRYGTAVGWIGMLLVHPELRRYGIGSAMLKHSVGYLEGRGVGSIKLDATPMGRHVYVQLGFADEYELMRYERAAAAVDGGSAPEAVKDDRTAESVLQPEPLPITDADMEELIAFDSVSFGIRRESVLRMLAERDGQYGFCIRKEGRISGYLMAHQGHHAVQAGPWAAADERSAETLLRAFLVRAEGRSVLLDVPVSNAAGLRLMEQYGFQVQRGFTRMYTGCNKHPGCPEGIYGTSGAEKG